MIRKQKNSMARPEYFARLDPMAGQEWRRGNPLAAGLLQFCYGQRSLAACHEDAFGIGTDNLTGGCSETAFRAGLPQPQSFATEAGLRNGERIESPHLALDGIRGL